ncbi:MAG TPA: HlyD family type I secretion periplasmic adaptor subunit, partial [Deltaproteobacteria bacterium]|nr:HlyD family type I secretion periplasmic adaptor subunit [Deltaproteobacteria bacterium]
MKADSPNFFRSFIEAWRGRGKLGDNRLGSIERNFLPAALEIQETPPSPAGRILAWSLMVLFTIAVIWACFGKVDIVSSAEGKTIPSGYVKQIQPLEKGVVKSILVKEGQLVQQGQPLIELDRTLTAADQAKLTKDLAYLDQTIRRQELFVKLLANPDQAANIPKLRASFLIRTSSVIPAQAGIQGSPDTLAPGVTAKRVVERIGERGVKNSFSHPERSEGSTATVSPTQDPLADDQFGLLLQQWRSHQTQRETLKAQLREKEAEKLSSLEVVRQLEATVPLINKRAGASKTLSDEGIVAESDYLKLKEELIQKSQALAAEKARQTQLAEAMAGIAKQLASLDAEAERKALAEIQDAQRQRQASLQELQKASDLNARQVLYAPVSGKVQQLAITTIGGVVQPAQVLMLIVPGDDKLEVEASIQN